MAVISRDGNVNTLNSDITSEILYETPGDNMSDKPFLMDVSERGHAEILDELTDLSANKGAYALREVYSNAHDATVKAGDMSRPIEITIPDVAYRTNSLAEKLAMVGGASGTDIEYAYVTDHGIGMTEYDLRTYFTQYGGSNKRDDATSIGSKGLGSKAPLAVADFFDVVTSKDGTKTGMHLWRAEGGNYAEVTSSEPCPIDETGTTVRIPVINPTIGKQMLECAQEIARYNSDANIVVNGTTTISTLNREVSSVSHIDQSDYVCLGPVQIGTDGMGNPVNVPVWLHEKVFATHVFAPWTSDNATCARIDFDRGGVRAVLCGIGYQLVEVQATRSYYYDQSQPNDPVCIVEVEPGYLNFTVSRDEIKDDAKKRGLIDGLREGVDAVNLWPIAIKMCAHSFKMLRSIVADCSVRCENGKWNITSSLSDMKKGIRYTLTDEDIEAFSDENGRSMLPLLATFDGSDPDGHDAKLLAWFSSAYNGKSARFHVAYSNKERDEDALNASDWDSDLLGWQYGTSSKHGGDGENSFSPNIQTIYELVDEVIPTSQIASAVRCDFDPNWCLMVIGGADAKAFSKAEHSIRRHVADAMSSTVRQTKILYALCEGPVSDDPDSPDCLSDAELALVNAMGGHVEVAMLDELAKRCAKEDRERRASGSSRPKRKGPKPLGSFCCIVADIDSARFADAEAIITATLGTEGIPNKQDNSLRYEQIDLDTLDKDDLVVIGRPDDSRVACIATQAILLQKLGMLDARYDRVVFVPASHDGNDRSKGSFIYAPQAKRLARQVTILDDIRDDWAVEHAKSVLDSACCITQTGVNIDQAGIAPTDTVKAMVACESLRVGTGGHWLIDNIDAGFELGRVAFEHMGKTSASRLAEPVLSITTADPATIAFKEWLRTVCNTIGAYAFYEAISNSDDPNIDFFVRSLIEGVIEDANEAYDKALTDSAGSVAA